MTIDLSVLKNAIDQADDALVYAHSDLAKADPKLALHLRAAAIQAFEFTYELSHKMLRRYLVQTEPSPSLIGELSFPDLIRLGYQRGIVRSEWAVWKSYRDHRNATSHAYDEGKAQEVFTHIPGFLSEARDLLEEITRRQK